MKVYHRILMIIFLAALVGSGCSDRPTGSNGGGSTIDNFPSAVGMLWKYEITDSLTDHKDTVWVSVTENRESIAIQTVFQWRYFWRGTGVVEDRVVALRENEVMILLDTTQGEPDYLERFVTPFESGSMWTGPFRSDTSRASYWRSCTVPAGTFTGVGRVDRVWNRDFEGGGNWSETWLDEDAGILKRHFLTLISDGTNIDTTRNEAWELIGYDLNTFELSRYPGLVGSMLRYQLVDDASGLTDTVTAVAIANFAWGEYDSVIAWEYIGREYADTHFVAFTPNSATFFIDPPGQPSLTMWTYEFPICVGKHWGYAYLVPMPTVDDKTALTTEFGSYATAFHYTMASSMVGGWSVDEWLVPGIGTVQRTYARHLGYPMQFQHWTLLFYQVGPDYAYSSR